ncbi:MAG: diguanylate cyclase [Acidobacteriota bacterium]|nr:diguanylate cyclase [Acidobacteriota bacterium]
MNSDPAGGFETTLELAAEAMLREHPDALVCALAADGLITQLPKSVGLWGQAALEGRALIDHVVAGDRNAVVDAWRRVKEEGSAEARVRLLSEPSRWMNLHFLDLREAHGVLVGVVIPTDEIAPDQTAGESAESATPRFATLTEDESAAVIDCDDAFTQMFGYAPEELIGRSVLDQIHPDDQGRAVEGWLTMLSTHRIQQSRMRRRRKDGTWVWVDSTMHNYLNQPGRGHVLVELIDVSAEMAAQEAVQEREELLRRLMDTMPDGVFQVDHEHRVMFHNTRLLEILHTAAHAGARQPAAATESSPKEGTQAYSLGEILAPLTEASTLSFHMALAQILTDGADEDVEVDAVTLGGEWRRMLMSIRALRRPSGEVNGAITTVLDITDSSRAREELERRATFDSLTHCYNRASILAALQRELSSENRNETAVVYVDLDYFKKINDSLGHATGDEVLVQVVERLKHATRSEDKVGRLGGDEFLLLIRGLPEPDVAMGVAKRICESLRTPLSLSTGELQLCASLGVAWADDPALSAEDLIKRADEAMYRSKEMRQGLPVLAEGRLPDAA